MKEELDLSVETIEEDLEEIIDVVWTGELNGEEYDKEPMNVRRVHEVDGEKLVSVETHVQRKIMSIPVEDFVEGAEDTEW